MPGDIVEIRLGVIVPADLRLVGGDYASIDQAALTGESLPATKKIGDEAYSGSIVKQGEMRASSSRPAPTPSSAARRSSSPGPAR